MKHMIDTALDLQRVSDTQVQIQKDLYEHQQQDKDAFNRIENKIDRLADSIDKQKNDYDYIILGIKVIGVAAFVAGAAIKSWFTYKG